MKLKLTTKPQAASEGPSVAPPVNPPNGASESTPTSASAPKLKFKLSTSSTVSSPVVSATPSSTHPPPSAEAPKQKRKYTKKPKMDDSGNAIPVAPKPEKPKKRPREETGEERSPVAKRKPKPTAKSLEMIHSDDDLDDNIHLPPASSIAAGRPIPPQPIRTGSTIKIKMKGSQPVRSNTTLLKIKGVHGKPPYRPPGVGYDSEAEEAEDDPAIESQFILRMQPGPDCDLLRKAIEEKTIGVRTKDGGAQGPSVQFRFFDQYGRRATVLIQGRMYAACMVDLPCVVESMKSWSKKDWVKTADICQMLLVLGRVHSEEEAKKFPLPPEVNPSSLQYAHGLTPPMHHVRKRRFRPRVSYHRIEQVEAEVNALLEADRRSLNYGGRAEFQVIDADKVDSSEESSDEDAEGEDDEMVDASGYVIEAQTPGGEEVEIEDGAFAELLQAGLMDGDEDNMANLFETEMAQGNEVEVEVETPATAHDVAMHALGENTIPTVETAASSPNAATSPDDDDEDDEDDAESPEDAEEDAEAAAELAGRETQLAEIRELEQEIEAAQSQFNTINNVLYKQRLKTKMERLQTDLGLKKQALGLDDGD